MESFTKQFKDEFKEFGNKASKAVTRAALNAWKVAVENTPHDTYTAQNGWKLSTTRRSSYIPIVRIQPPPTKPDFKFLISRHSKVILFNNVPYISFLENGQGRGTRTAHFMMRKAKERFESDLNKFIGDMK